MPTSISSLLQPFTGALQKGILLLLLFGSLSSLEATTYTWNNGWSYQYFSVPIIVNGITVGYYTDSTELVPGAVIGPNDVVNMDGPYGDLAYRIGGRTNYGVININHPGYYGYYTSASLINYGTIRIPARFTIYTTVYSGAPLGNFQLKPQSRLEIGQPGTFQTRTRVVGLFGGGNWGADSAQIYVASGDSLILDVNFRISGDYISPGFVSGAEIYNLGTIVNNGNFRNDSGAYINNNNWINNGDYESSAGSSFISGSFRNEAGANCSNQGSMSFVIFDNYGSATGGLQGTMNNYGNTNLGYGVNGALFNQSGISFSGSVSGNLYNDGSFSGTVVGTASNSGSGTMNLSGNMTSLTNAGICVLGPATVGILQNSNSILTGSNVTVYNELVNWGDFENVGSIIISSATIKNHDTFVNRGSIDGTGSSFVNFPNGMWDNRVGSSLTISGLLNNDGYLSNAGQVNMRQDPSLNSPAIHRNGGSWHNLSGGILRLESGVSFAAQTTFENQGSLYNHAGGLIEVDSLATFRNTSLGNSSSLLRNEGQVHIELGGLLSNQSGTLENQPGARITNAGSISNLDDIINVGDIDNSGGLFNRANLYIAGDSLINTGSLINYANALVLVHSSGTVLDNRGTLSNSQGGAIKIDSLAHLTNGASGAAAQVNNSGVLTIGYQSTFENTSTGTLVNDGEVQVLEGVLDNHYIIDNNAGGRIAVGAAFTNYSYLYNLAGAEVEILPNGSFQNDFQVNNFDGARFVVDSLGQLTNGNAGSGIFDNAGELELRRHGSFTNQASLLTQTSGALHVHGVMDHAATGSVDHSGLLAGSGLINLTGNWNTLDGIIAPGDSLGALTVNGNMDLGPATYVAQIDPLLDVNDTLRFNGLASNTGAGLDIVLTELPLVSDTFQILMSTNPGTGFLATNLPTIPGFVLTLLYESDGIRLAVTDATAFPVEWLGFEAAPVGNQVRCSWKTAWEENTHEFVVERSTDAVHFEEVVRTPAAGSSQGARSYEAWDPAPHMGRSYYRVKEIDLDGNESYTPQVQLQLQADLQMSLYPNPADALTHLQLELRSSEQVNMQLIDAQGRQVWTLQRELPAGSHRLDIDVSHLSEGIYTLELRRTRGVGRMRLMVK